MKIGLYIDVSNLYYCLYNNMKGKLNYSGLLDFFEPLGSIIIRKAYGAQLKDEAKTFIAILEKLGFEAIYKEPKYYAKGGGAYTNGKADWDVGIAVDCIKDMSKVDAYILGTADGDMSPLVKYLIEDGKTVIIFGNNISKELREVATKAIEIPASLLI